MHSAHGYLAIDVFTARLFKIRHTQSDIFIKLDAMQLALEADIVYAVHIVGLCSTQIVRPVCNRSKQPLADKLSQAFSIPANAEEPQIVNKTRKTRWQPHTLQILTSNFCSAHATVFTVYSPRSFQTQRWQTAQIPEIQCRHSVQRLMSKGCFPPYTKHCVLLWRYDWNKLP